MSTWEVDHAQAKMVDDEGDMLYVMPLGDGAIIAVEGRPIHDRGEGRVYTATQLSPEDLDRLAAYIAKARADDYEACPVRVEYVLLGGLTGDVRADLGHERTLGHGDLEAARRIVGVAVGIRAEHVKIRAIHYTHWA